MKTRDFVKVCSDSGAHKTWSRSLLLKDFQFRGVVFNSPWTEMKSATWSQFNKTDASVINKCSFCFYTLKQGAHLQITPVKVLLNWPMDVKSEPQLPKLTSLSIIF